MGYRHLKHAANIGDLIKHLVLVELLTLLCSRDSAVRYLDTHAGEGVYQLPDEYTAQAVPHQREACWLWQLKIEGLDNYFSQIGRLNPGVPLTRYPGSAVIADTLLRPSDHAILVERDPGMHAALKRAVTREATELILGDGFNLLGQLPRDHRRLCALVDPPYQCGDEYARVLHFTRQFTECFGSATLCVWYPVKHPEDTRLLEREMRRLVGSALGVYELVYQSPRRGQGLAGAGMLLVNPPRELHPLLVSQLQILVSAFAPQYPLECRSEEG